MPARRRTQLLAAATIDGDTTDVEVYGRDKQDAVYNYQGQRAYRPHIAFWAEGGVSLAADLMKADEDPRPVAAQLLDRAIAQLPPGVAKIRCRWDAGYFAADLAKHCIDRGVEFAIGVKRNSAVVRASREAPTDGWHPAKDMPHTEVAVIDYLPGTWPEGAGVVCIARRTRIPVELMPTDPRARKLRTIDKAQQALALEGKLDYVYGYSFILTNLDVSTPAKLVEVEHWYRHRTDIEALNKDAKHGAALRHLPSGDRTVNTVWMWAALLACAISNWIQEITGIDDGRGRARRTLARMRRELFNIPARVTRTTRALTLRPPPGTRARLLNHVVLTTAAGPADHPRRITPEHLTRPPIHKNHQDPEPRPPGATAGSHSPDPGHPGIRLQSRTETQTPPTKSPTNHGSGSEALHRRRVFLIVTAANTHAAGGDVRLPSAGRPVCRNSGSLC